MGRGGANMRFASTFLVLATLLTVGAQTEDATDPMTRLVERLLPNHAKNNPVSYTHLTLPTILRV